jgi:hypothetical protein
MRASAPVMAKSPISGNAWLTTQFARTGLGCAASAVSPTILRRENCLIFPPPPGVAHEFALSNLLLVLNYSPEALNEANWNNTPFSNT